MEKIKFEIKIREEIEKLFEMSEGYVGKEISMAEMETGILQQLLKLGLSLLSYIIEQKLRNISDYEFEQRKGETNKNTGKSTRNYLSLFGLMKIRRPSHWIKEIGEVHKLDECLQLPIGSFWSYNIQKLVGGNSSETNFRESVQTINELLGLGLSGKSSERNTERLGEYVEEFYDLHTYQSEEEGLHFVCSYDGKGVPKIKPALEIRNNPKERLARGEKKGVKQMATVSIVSSFTPQQKTSDAIIIGLMGQEKKEGQKKEKGLTKEKNTDNKLYKNIHRRGFLANQDKAIQYGMVELKARMTNPKSRFVVPIDAGIGLEDKVLSYVEKYKLKSKFDGIVIDIVHVSEYVWDAANAIFGEKSKLRRDWVKGVLKDLLESKTKAVINELKINRDKTNLTETKIKQINKVITYFTNHQHKMNYQWFLKKGYPISSAIVESTCKHLIKDRMEKSGMRWTCSGAQNMMDLRAVKVNGDMAEFMDFIIKKDRKVNVNKSAA